MFLFRFHMKNKKKMKEREEKLKFQWRRAKWPTKDFFFTKMVDDIDRYWRIKLILVCFLSFNDLFRKKKTMIRRLSFSFHGHYCSEQRATWPKWCSWFLLILFWSNISWYNTISILISTLNEKFQNKSDGFHSKTFSYSSFINFHFNIFCKWKKSIVNILKWKINCFFSSTKPFETRTMFPFALVSINLIPYSVASWKTNENLMKISIRFSRNEPVRLFLD